MTEEKHLRVYTARSELVQSDGTSEIFQEGPQNAETRQRYTQITKALAEGFLSQQIETCRDQPDALGASALTDQHSEILGRLVASVTSEVGRAVVGLTVLQLCVKSLEPLQSIRLHKGGTGARDFSWQGGISMRSLDNQFITPTLRHYGLLKLNRDGFMMTRSLAENYPYSALYKAQIRGAKGEWIKVVEALESGILPPLPALKYVLSKLLNLADDFQRLADQTLALVRQRTQDVENPLSVQQVLSLLQHQMNTSDYGARILEIIMHALMQALAKFNVLDGASLVPLSQMRSANKKHGNIADIETHVGHEIREAWDAKYGKAYLRDELEELGDKLEHHSAVLLAGFVSSVKPERLKELEARRLDLEALSGVTIQILTLDEWMAQKIEQATATGRVTEAELAAEWLNAYAESLAQRRPQLAPIDEPCYRWLESLYDLLTPSL
ncbi:hypothetical protein [Deinococcus sp.]|uniref:hypothetical protein n=1 Tax=Deinococcus sp. TaxID=47478 RepID=UPI003B5AF25F